MANMKEIKKRIKSISDTKKITNAMYLTSSAKLSSGRIRLAQLEPRLEAVEKQIKAIAPFIKENKYVSENPQGKVLYLLIGSDRGLAGDFSKETVKKYEKLSEKENEVYVLGSAVRRICSAKKINCNPGFNFSFRKPDYSFAKEISDTLLERYKSGEISKIIILYNDLFHSETVVKEKQYLPLIIDKTEPPEFSFYPDRASICEKIISEYLVNCIYGVLLKSYCAEQNSRMTAMDNANKNAGKLLDELTVQFNHQRQNTITREITEIAFGAGSRSQNGVASGEKI